MHKVLFVDDDAFVAKLYTTLLQNEGIAVEVASGGKEALEKLSVVRPDLIVLDLIMPEVSGVEVLKFIRSHSQFRNLPVIVFSNGYVQRLIDEAEALGPQKIFSKHMCKPARLVEEIKGMLAERGGRPEPRPEAHIGSVLERAVAFISDENIEPLHVWLRRLHMDEREEARRVCLIHIYKILQETLETAISKYTVSPLGRLSQALKLLLTDLYEFPRHITDSTMKTLDQSLQKLFDLREKNHLQQLESEVALRGLLADLNNDLSD